MKDKTPKVRVIKLSNDAIIVWVNPDGFEHRFAMNRAEWELAVAELQEWLDSETTQDT